MVKHNKIMKATSVVMSAVVAGMVMGHGACYATESGKPKQKKSAVAGKTTNVRNFVKNTSKKECGMFGAGFCTAALASLLIAAAKYRINPNILKGMAKYVVTTSEEDGNKLIVLKIKGYNFEDGAADALLVLCTEDKTSKGSKEEEDSEDKTSEDSKEEEDSENKTSEGLKEEEDSENETSKGSDNDKYEVLADGTAIAVNKVYKLDDGIKQAALDSFGENIGKGKGGLPVVEISARDMFGWCLSKTTDINVDYAKAFISAVENSVKPVEKVKEQEKEN